MIALIIINTVFVVIVIGFIIRREKHFLTFKNDVLKKMNETVPIFKDKFEEIAKAHNKIADHIKHIYFLMDIVSDTLPYPLKVFYKGIRELQPENTPQSRKDALIFFKDTLIKNLTLARLDISISKKDIDKEKQHEMLHIMDSAITLLGTLDKNTTSEEYITAVLQDTIISIDKIINMGKTKDYD